MLRNCFFFLALCQNPGICIVKRVIAELAPNASVAPKNPASCETKDAELVFRLRGDERVGESLWHRMCKFFFHTLKRSACMNVQLMNLPCTNEERLVVSELITVKARAEYSECRLPVEIQNKLI